MSITRKLIGVLAATMLLAGGLLTGTASAAAKKYCVSNNHGSYVCFQPHGDKMWVKDTKKDGYAAGAVFETSYGRKGQCHNVEGKGVLIRCNFNMREGARIKFWAVNIEKNTAGDRYYYWSTDRQTII